MLPDGLPAALCVKGYFNDIGRAARQIGAPEAYFYRHLAVQTRVRTLHSVYADIDPATHHGVIITEDVVPQGATFLDGNSPYTADQTAQSLTELAAARRDVGAARYADPPWLAPRLGRALDVWGEAKDNRHHRR